jgi:hypothetical protein
MSIYVIENGVIVPKTRKVSSKYPFMKMEVGQSVLIADKKIGYIRSYVSTLAKKSGMKFRVLAADGGVRVWRIEKE